MHNINLFYLASTFEGGWRVYTHHLCEGLKKFGINFNIYLIQKRKSSKTKEIVSGIFANIVTIEEAIAIASSDYSLMITADWRNRKTDISRLGGLMPIAVHSVSELRQHPDFIKYLQDKQILVAREAVRKYAEDAGITAHYIPYPYKRFNINAPYRVGFACSICRVDYIKHTDILVKANMLLPEDMQIHIYGNLNKLYEYRVLRSIDPDWMRNYKGVHYGELGSGVELASQYDYVIDLTVIKQDGGEIQFTFLETFESGSELIINSRWLEYGNNELEGILTVKDEHELVDLLLNNELDVFDGSSILENHSLDVIIPMYVQLYERIYEDGISN